MDLDIALRVDSHSLTDTSSLDEKKYYEKWDSSNRISLMIIKCGIPEIFRGAVSDEVSAKDFLAEIENGSQKAIRRK